MAEAQRKGSSVRAFIIRHQWVINLLWLPGTIAAAIEGGIKGARDHGKWEWNGRPMTWQYSENVRHPAPTTARQRGE